MNERVVEILVYLMSQIRADNDKIDRIDGMSKELRNQGYTENEINTAFSWLFEKIQTNQEEIFDEPQFELRHGFRVLHEAEKVVIHPEAHGYLIQLKELGIITQSDMEQIIERAMMLGVSSVTDDDIKSIVVSLLFNSDDADDQLLGRTIMDKNGTIN
ncbi:hypothetical protein BMS3Abin05_00402 [bacterium BMS3Abin05]|nr:hypothetical protein BMS3Abin05_00402 [bacterium BMS3Abin05]GBE26961.1 hypothetical protein BMS3Bbin03_00881 [bacterium BMS3Bbin03]HDZ12079.1 DUF494 family protein [Bacteroidota bacterium]